MALHPIVQAALEGWNLGQAGKRHADDLAFRMAQSKQAAGFKNRELAQQDDSERLKYGEQGLNLDEQRAGESEAQSADMADNALGEGTSEALGIGASGARGKADSQMSTFIGRMSRKQEAGVKDTEAQARQREETAKWMARRHDKGPGGSQAATVAAQKAILVPLQKKIAMGEELSPEEQDTFDSTSESLAKIGGFEYTPKNRDAAPPAPKPSLFEKMAGAAGKLKSAFNSGAGGPQASADPKQRYFELRKQGKSPDEAHRAAYGQ